MTLDYIKEQITYEPNTGLFFWNIKKKGRVLGKPVGSKTGVHGSVRLLIDGVVWYGHKLAWFYMTGHRPDYIGFKDFNSNNLKWDNLEQITKQEYLLRRKALIPNPVENIRPIVQNYTTGQWYLQTRVADKVIKGPYFDDPRDAVRAWVKIDEVRIDELKANQRKSGYASFSATEIKQALKDYISSD